MLSTAAFNAFLKTLEEPPAHAIFILATTEKHKILPTILSRCQTFDFNRISVPDIVGNLRAIAAKEDVKIDDESLHVIAQKADGAMRDALTIFDQTVAFCGTDVRYDDVIRNLGVLDYDYSFGLVDTFLAGDYGKALLTFDEVLSKGFNTLHFSAALSSHLRDLMVAKNGGLDSLLELPDSLKKRYVEQASRCPLKFLYDALGITTACEAGYKQAVNPRLHIEFALMKLCFLMKAPETDPRRDLASRRGAAGEDHATLGTVRETSEPPALRQAQGPEKQAQGPEKPTPSPAPRERRRPAKTGSALSLSAILEDAESGKAAEKASPVSNELPEDEAILKAWEGIPEEYSSKPRLANTLKNALVEIGTDEGLKILTFKVSNASQQQWIRENSLRSLEGYLQTKVRSSKLRLEVGVIPMEEKKAQPYTDQEKASALMGANGEVQNLIKDFGLETK